GAGAAPAVGDRDRHREHLEAARRPYILVGGEVALIGDHTRNVDTEFGLLERRLPQAVRREDERDGRDDGGDGLAGSGVRCATRNLVRAFVRLLARSLKPSHAGLPKFPLSVETPLRS